MTSRNVLWSHSRARLLRDCPRAFYLKYVCGGERGKAARALASLATVPMVAGAVVDLVVAHALDRPDRGDLGRRGSRLFRRVVEDGARAAQASAAEGALPNRLPRPASPLLHAYLGLDLGQRYIEDMAAGVEACLSRFEESDELAGLRSSPRDALRLSTLEGPPSPVRIEGLKILASPDAVVLGRSVRILDFKAGRASAKAKDEASRQLALYGLVEWARRGVASTNVSVQAIWLSEGCEESPSPFGPEGVASALAEMSRDRADLMSRLSAIEGGASPERAFQADPHPQRCGHCPFRALCREGAMETDHLPMGPRLPDGAVQGDQDER